MLFVMILYLDMTVFFVIRSLFGFNTPLYPIMQVPVELNEETLTLHRITLTVDEIFRSDPEGFRFLYQLCQFLNLFFPQLENLTTLAFFFGRSDDLARRVRILCEAVLSFPPPQA